MIAPLKTSAAHFQLIQEKVKERLPNFYHLVMNYLKPLYFLNSSPIRPINDLPENIIHKRVVKAFFAGGTDGMPFRKNLKAILTVHKVLYETRDPAHPLIAVPSSTALEVHVKHYREKYRIEIHVCCISRLNAFLMEKRKNISSLYVGVIVTSDKGLVGEGHVVSLLCYLSGYGEY